ncbi:nucleoside phosphorylase [Geotalea sp. SG265]|uniref:phosphorylase family protein n=1 Tax=Geotalea sp. SG265 TaxID=2922867 RepID=UPI001FAF81A7|nr:nucleoside phosphorylase [Geotalea sp. SG265]
MTISTIGLIAAMPEEIKPLLRRIGTYEKEQKETFELYRFVVGDKKVMLIRSGMGARHATAATRSLVAAAIPDIILNFGFAGAITAGPDVGDLVLAERVFSYDGSSFTQGPTPSASLVDSMERLTASDTAGSSLFRGTFVTTLKITEKRTLAKVLPDHCPCPAVEMETAAVAAEAGAAGIPFAAMRAVSDAADEELGFSLDEFTDGDMNIRMTKVLATVARKPGIIPQLLRLAGNSRTAGERLAKGMEAFIRGV